MKKFEISAAKTNIIKFSFFLISIYYIPITLIWSDVIPHHYRFHWLLFIFFIAIVYSFWQRHSLIDLGFRRDNLASALRLNLLVVFSFSIVLLIAYFLGWIRPSTVPDWEYFFVLFFLIFSPAQEFLFRSLIFHEMKLVSFPPTVQVFISAITYCYAHIFYNDLLTLLSTLGIGIIWGIIYLVRPNLWAVSLSHSILGVIAIYVGLI